jgi:lipoprotein NlpD
VSLAVWSLAIVLAGCANLDQQDAAADHNPSAVVSTPAPAAAPSSDTTVIAQDAPPPVASKPAKPVKPAPPATYKVRRGDTVQRIARSHNITVRQLQGWNRLKPSAHVKPGQTLVVSSPDAARNAAAAAAAASAAAATVQTSAVGAPAASAASSATPSTSTQASAPSPSADATPPADAPGPDEVREVHAALARHANGVALAWPAQGSVVEGFQAGETRGIEIGGKPGDPVRAAADGKVMYAGTGLNEYGSLIIVQHNKDFLTAYSHNRKLMVKMGDIVRKGQQIAEMGSENNSRVSLGFEVRRDGKPVDPMPYLPRPRG